MERSGLLGHFDNQTRQAFDLLRSPGRARRSDLDQEPAAVRERYGHSPFGQSVLLARRLVEAGVTLVQVNWYRGPDEPSDNPCWDSHVKESERLKTVLLPPIDQAYSALLDDLVGTGNAGRDAGGVPGGIRPHPEDQRQRRPGPLGPRLFGGAGRRRRSRRHRSTALPDKIGGYPKEGRVQPEDLTATIFHCLGYAPNVEVRDALGRPQPISRGDVIRQAL